MNRNPYPAISAVYVLRDWKGNALYAGSTANIRRRLQSHQHRGKFANVEIIPCAKELLRQEEQKLIDELRPILNINPVATRKGERAPQHRSGLKLPPKTSEEKRAQVRAALTKRRERLMKAGLCRDCGLQPVSTTAVRKPNGKPNSRRKATLCDRCKQDRRARSAAKKAA